MGSESKHSLSSMNSEETMPGDFPGKSRLAEMGLELHELRKVIHSMMVERQTPQFVASSVRASSFSEWSGGLKSDLIGRLELSVATGLKLGGSELYRDMEILQAINQAGKAICVEPLTITKIPDGHYVLLMEALDKHSPMINLIYEHPVPPAIQHRLVDRVFQALAQVRKATHIISANSRVIQNLDPYSNRLRSKVIETYRTHKALNIDGILENPGFLGTVACPAVEGLVEEACSWLATHSTNVKPVLAHGDPHLGNILVRRRGKGYSFRLIDPNGDIGLTDPMYDFGKLLHWSEKLGWSQISPKMCQVKHEPAHGKSNWSLTASVVGVSKAAERRRQRLEEQVFGLAAAHCNSDDDLARLYLSVASAHAGLLFLYAEKRSYCLARFAAYYTLRALLRWRKNAKNVMND